MIKSLDAFSNPGLKILLVVKFALLAMFFATLFAIPAKAETVCEGENILDEFAKSDPATLARVEKRAATIPNGEGLLWKIERDGVEPSYVFGTMHISDPRIVDLPAKTAKALDQSDVLALEILEILDPIALQQKMSGLIKYTMYLDGTTMPQKASEKDIGAIRGRIEEMGGMPWQMVSRMKPWVLMSLIAVPACELERKQKGASFLDKSLGELAKSGGKELVGLETLESQVKAMDSLPEDMMIAALADTARLGSKVEDVFETMIQLYRKGETAKIWAMMREMTPDALGIIGQSAPDESGYALFQELIVDKRNRQMIEEAIPLIDKGRAFIAVGALHLPGEIGMLNLLETRGYRVTRADTE